jgi:hypothetical protein
MTQDPANAMLSLMSAPATSGTWRCGAVRSLPLGSRFRGNDDGEAGMMTGAKMTIGFGTFSGGAVLTADAPR